PSGPAVVEPGAPSALLSDPPFGLRGFVRRAEAAAAAAQEHCDLCAEPVPAEHRHLLEVEARQISCVCVPCSILFDRDAAGMCRLRLIPDGRIRLEADVISDLDWAALEIPVGVAFLFFSTSAGRMVAGYPSPAGPVESLLALDGWNDAVAREPLLATL